ncbi:hypothetical protein Ahy_A08g040681 isoform B [Arachis hypogaea]|uniref:Uncharacterized protein n=1 Tax=Arachis hypogaea TaxID=3818 RepID=A0A445C000_ARAHY|nr:hypothetical protein Ahy_A08g040681 isoform B [Arachis hypogaea]
MDKGPPPALFVNDGSFMEKFKQLQQEQEKEKNNKLSEPKPIKVVSGSLAPKTSISRVNDTRKTSQAGSSGKLAFSLKQKSKLVPPPVKLADDEEEETDAGDFSNAVQAKRQKVDQEDGTAQPSRQLDVGNYFHIIFVQVFGYRKVIVVASASRHTVASTVFSVFLFPCLKIDLCFNYLSRIVYWQASYKSNFHSIVHALGINQFYK